MSCVMGTEFFKKIFEGKSVPVFVLVFKRKVPNKQALVLSSGCGSTISKGIPVR